MNSCFTPIALVFLGMVFASFSPGAAAAGEDDAIPITNADWITAGMPGVAQGVAPGLGTPGVHTHGSGGDAPGQNVPMPVVNRVKASALK